MLRAACKSIGSFYLMPKFTRSYSAVDCPDVAKFTAPYPRITPILASHVQWRFESHVHDGYGFNPIWKEIAIGYSYPRTSIVSVARLARYTARE
jgi:hypothetical protein